MKQYGEKEIGHREKRDNKKDEKIAKGKKKGTGREKRKMKEK